MFWLLECKELRVVRDLRGGKAVRAIRDGKAVRATKAGKE